jgi:hypothetical protein
MNHSTPIRDRLAFRGLTLSTDEMIIHDKKCHVATYEPYLANDGDGAIVKIFDFGVSIHHNRYFAIEKSNHYNYFLIGYELLNDGGSVVNNISSLSNDDLSIAANILNEYLETIESGGKWNVRI